MNTPNVIQLHALLLSGEIGKLFAAEFKGERNVYYPPNQDYETVLMFNSPEEVPKCTKVSDVLIKHFTQLGYAVDDFSINREAFPQLCIRVPGDRFIQVLVMITPNHPFRNSVNTIQISTREITVM